MWWTSTLATQMARLFSFSPPFTFPGCLRRLTDCLPSGLFFFSETLIKLSSRVKENNAYIYSTIYIYAYIYICPRDQPIKLPSLERWCCQAGWGAMEGNKTWKVYRRANHSGLWLLRDDKKALRINHDPMFTLQVARSSAFSLGRSIIASVVTKSADQPESRSRVTQTSISLHCHTVLNRSNLYLHNLHTWEPVVQDNYCSVWSHMGFSLTVVCLLSMWNLSGCHSFGDKLAWSIKWWLSLLWPGDA